CQMRGAIFPALVSESGKQTEPSGCQCQISLEGISLSEGIETVDFLVGPEIVDSAQVRPPASPSYAIDERKHELTRKPNARDCFDLPDGIRELAARGVKAFDCANNLGVLPTGGHRKIERCIFSSRLKTTTHHVWKAQPCDDLFDDILETSSSCNG